MYPELSCALAVVLFLFVSVCSSAPVDDYYLNQGLDFPDEQKIKLYRELEEYIPKTLGHSQVQEHDQSYPFRSIAQKFVPQLSQRLSAMKRFQSLRTQTRAGGVVLCLWKVCPAAPWLVSERLK